MPQTASNDGQMLISQYANFFPRHFAKEIMNKPGIGKMSIIGHLLHTDLFLRLSRDRMYG